MTLTKLALKRDATVPMGIAAPLHLELPMRNRGPCYGRSCVDVWTLRHALRWLWLDRALMKRDDAMNSEVQSVERIIEDAERFPMMPRQPLRIICAWCHPGASGDGLSHGICDACKRVMLENY